MLEALSRCYLLDGHELLSTPSIGVVLFCQEHHTINDLLRQADPDLRFAHLDGARELIAARMGARTAHFMPASLLDSQLRDLEPLGADEAGGRIDIVKPPAALAQEILDL